ncbi:MAG: DUF1566 domain-containing protein [Epsilonproteobacteria bacterium]|nr:DUF1566 domain-containing protein [Campylobacterota bacterium]
MYKIFLVLITISVMVYADFTRNHFGIVLDSKQGLEWQDDYSDNEQVIKKANWQDAKAYCRALDLDMKGWRLPTKDELLLLHKRSEREKIFQEKLSEHYWSLNQHFGYEGYAWGVHFNLNYYGSYKKSNLYKVRCVRSRK